MWTGAEAAKNRKFSIVFAPKFQKTHFQNSRCGPVPTSRGRQGAAIISRLGGGKSGKWRIVADVAGMHLSCGTSKGDFAILGRMSVIKSRQKLGKYRIERKLGEGGFAAVFQAYDTIEGLRVALKIPYAQVLDPAALEAFQREVRMAAQLDHPHILPLKNADFIEGRFVVTFPLGERTLLERLQSRLSLATALEFADQMMDAVAYAHEQRVIHCDIKPENLILFPHNRLMLSDFGLAKIALRTIRALGFGHRGLCGPRAGHGQAIGSIRRVLFGADHLPHVGRPASRMAV